MTTRLRVRTAPHGHRGSRNLKPIPSERVADADLLETVEHAHVIARIGLRSSLVDPFHTRSWRVCVVVFDFGRNAVGQDLEAGAQFAIADS